MLQPAIFLGLLQRDCTSARRNTTASEVVRCSDVQDEHGRRGSNVQRSNLVCAGQSVRCAFCIRADSRPLGSPRSSRVPNLGPQLPLRPGNHAAILAKVHIGIREAPVTGGRAGVRVPWGGTCDGEGNPSQVFPLHPLCDTSVQSFCRPGSATLYHFSRR